MANEPTCKKWDFIRQMRGIFKIKNSLTLAEYKLLTTLFEVNNDQGRRETFQVDNKSLAELAGMKTPNIISLRKSLQAKGFISCEAGKKGKPTTYRMLILYDIEKGYAETTETENKGYAETTLNYAETTLNYAETTKKVSNPLGRKGCETPKRLVKGIVKDICASDLFQTFYDAYPKKQDKQRAKKIFLKLNPDEELFQRMMAALEAQKASYKASDDWQQSGWKYFKMPSTWLYNARWEDEVEVNPPSHENTIEQRDAERMAQAAAEEAYLKGADANGET